MLKIELLIQFRLRSLLRENEFQFMSGPKFELRIGFGANTDPINIPTCYLRPIGFDGNLESYLMDSVDQRLVQLQKRFPASADNKWRRFLLMIGPRLFNCGC